MNTIEVKGLTEAQERILRDSGYKLEYLDQEYYNVLSEPEWTDVLTDVLDSWCKSWRLV